MFIFILLAMLVICILCDCIKIVSESNLYVVEFLGKYKRTMSAGINFKIPIVEKVAKRISLKEQVADFPPQPVITKDNVTMQIDTVVYYKISDAKLYTYGVSNPILAIENLTATTLRNIIGELELDDTLTSRDVINSKMCQILDEATDKWGIKITRVELKNIMPPKEIQASMEKQMKAERERRETLLEAEGHKQAVVLREEGNKEARILEAESRKAAAIAEAEGKAQAITLVYEAEANGIQNLMNTVGKDGVMLMKKLESLEKVADGRATKIVLPSELTTSASNLTYLNEMLGMPGAMAIDSSPREETKIEFDACCDDKDIKPAPKITDKPILTAEDRKNMITKLMKETDKQFNACYYALSSSDYNYEAAKAKLN